MEHGNIKMKTYIKETGYEAFHKSNPSSLLRGTVDSYFTLPWVMWEMVTVVEGIP